jgi:cell division protein FtsL
MATKNKSKIATLETFRNAAKNAPKDAVRVSDVEVAVKEFELGFEKGSDYLKAQKVQLTNENHKVLLDGVAIIASAKSVFASVHKAMQDAVEASQKSFADSLAGIDWDRVKTETEAYSALSSHLDAAINDPKVQKSPDILKLIQYISSEIGKTGIGENDKQFRYLIGTQEAKRIASTAASKNAKSKNQAARDFVIEKWSKHIADPSNSKNKKTFAAKILPIVKEEFKIKNLTANTIERDWLPKTKPRKRI